MMALFPTARKVFIMDTALSCQVPESNPHQFPPFSILVLGVKPRIVRIGSKGLHLLSRLLLPSGRYLFSLWPDKIPG